MSNLIDDADVKPKGVCPACGSRCNPKSPITLKNNSRVYRSIVNDSLLTECIITTETRRYTCENCGNKWIETDHV